MLPKLNVMMSLRFDSWQPGPRGQRFMGNPEQTVAASEAAVPARQSLPGGVITPGGVMPAAGGVMPAAGGVMAARCRPGGWRDASRWVRWLALWLSLCGWGASGFAQLFDSLDSYPPRWSLFSSDCHARVTAHTHLVTGGSDGGGCESITFVSGQGGTEVLWGYPIEPVRPLDDLAAQVEIRSARVGARIGLRVRFPYLRSPATGRPVSVLVYGDSYDRAGEFRTLRVRRIERSLTLRRVALRREYGAGADLSDPYVDAVVINAYSGPGRTSLRIDDLRIDGMVPVGPRSGGQDIAAVAFDDPRSAPGDGGVNGGRSSSRAFPPGRVTRILQHNGEPLEWVRTLGFDAVLLSRPPTAAILREAISARVRVYAPPPASPDPALEPLLDPIAGWYLGVRVALDRERIESTARLAGQLRRWPTRWRRPLVGSPLESLADYTAHLDAVVDHLPPRNRGLSGDEEIRELRRTAQRLPSGVQHAVGISGMPSDSLWRQTDAIADRIGAPRASRLRWHSMWIQTLRSLEVMPAAIIVRSTRSLASGGPMDAQRGMAMSYINRMVAAVEPWAAEATPAPPPSLRGAAYRCGRLRNDQAEVWILTSETARGSETLAGDGQAIEIDCSPQEASKSFWRMTHFTAERLLADTNSEGSRLEIVSPDAVEIVLVSDDPATGGRAASHAGRFLGQAALDRWQLTQDAVDQVRTDWMLAAASGITADRGAIDLAEVAGRTLRQAEPLYRAGELSSALRMARRADAWGLRSSWRLAERLMPDWPHPTSAPPVEVGSLETQISWFPLMGDEGWGRNRVVAGDLEQMEELHDGRWGFGQRLVGRAESQVRITRRGAFRGDGALQARVVATTEDGLAGGYEGTAIQIRAPGVRVAAGSAIRIDAMVRTVGFGHPHQGLLVYDTIGGQEAGILVRGRADWTPVRLYRQTIDEANVHVMFELIGAGEATIDEVQLRVWEPDGLPPPQLLPLEPRADTSAAHAADQDLQKR